MVFILSTPPIIKYKYKYIYKYKYVYICQLHSTGCYKYNKSIAGEKVPVSLNATCGRQRHKRSPTDEKVSATAPRWSENKAQRRAPTPATGLHAALVKRVNTLQHLPVTYIKHPLGFLWTIQRGCVCARVSKQQQQRRQQTCDTPRAASFSLLRNQRE